MGLHLIETSKDEEIIIIVYGTEFHMFRNSWQLTTLFLKSDIHTHLK